MAGGVLAAARQVGDADADSAFEPGSPQSSRIPDARNFRQPLATDGPAV